MYFYSGYLLAVFISFLIAILAMVNGFEIYFGGSFRLPFTNKRIRGTRARWAGGGLFAFGLLALMSLLISLLF